MKNFKIYFLGLLALSLAQACYDGIDEISTVDPGPDAGAPIVEILRPADGLEIQVPEPTTSTMVDFRVTDDIEVGTVRVLYDGLEIASFNQFIDYRTADEEFMIDNITTGDHTITVEATDKAGNITTSTNSFTKAPPYTPIFPGEQLYMPFDGDFTDLISVTEAETVGNPGFAGESYQGANALRPGAGNYLNFPLDDLNLTTNFSAAFWYKVNADPTRAGILVIGDDADDRFQGFRLFREGSPDSQTIKLNVGTGAGESWNNGGSIDAAAGDWVHVAFTISDSETKIYLNGSEVNMATMASPIDWTGASEINIGSGGPTFDYWNHGSDNSAIDELRLFDITLSQTQITQMVAQGSQIFQMSFNGSYTESYSDQEATVVGNPGFAGEAYAGTNAYAGAADSYLTFPTTGLLEDEFSASFWYKLNNDPDRAGLLVVGPEDPDNPDAQNNRTSGFRFFRENAGGMQRFKLNVGNGSGDSWFDGGPAADVDPSVDDWVHLAFTISGTEAVVYINGEIVSQNEFPGVDWTGSDIISIMSGAPRFTGWGHLSDQSYMDELKIFNRALTQEEIQALGQ